MVESNVRSPVIGSSLSTFFNLSLPAKSTKFNLSIKDLKLEILIISNFTLNAKTRIGNRPDFSEAKNPKDARNFYELFISKMKSVFDNIQTGEFGENMEIESNNDGPVNIIIDSFDQLKPRNSF